MNAEITRMLEIADAIDFAVSHTGKLEAADHAAAYLRIAAKKMREIIEANAFRLCEKTFPETTWEDQPETMKQRFREMAAREM